MVGTISNTKMYAKTHTDKNIYNVHIQKALYTLYRLCRISVTVMTSAPQGVLYVYHVCKTFEHFHNLVCHEFHQSGVRSHSCSLQCLLEYCVYFPFQHSKHNNKIIHLLVPLLNMIGIHNSQRTIAHVPREGYHCLWRLYSNIMCCSTGRGCVLRPCFTVSLTCIHTHTHGQREEMRQFRNKVI